MALSTAGAALAVFVGSGVGGVLRWSIGRAASDLLSGRLPPIWSGVSGTFAVNAIGSLLLAALLAQGERLPQPVMLLLGTGMMGGFTTYSTFNAEVLRAAMGGAPLTALGYACATLLTCLLAGGLGWWLSRGLVG
jgi:CrcB protein